MAADEWAENVDNNAFTNAAAKAVLLDATEAAKLLGMAPNPDWAQVAAPNYLNYRKVSIYGGSNEVQRTIIAGSILGL